MKAVFVTIFPELIESFFSVGVINKALDESIINFEVVNPIKFLKNSERLDDAPYGGGPGMLFRSEHIEEAINESKKLTSSNAKVINLSPQGKKLTQEKAKKLALDKELIFVCGRYEGIDQRFINNFVNEEISIGDYVLSGGEIAACVVIDTILRNIEGVIGKKESVSRDSFSDGKLKGHVYTRPKEFEGDHVPEILLSGDHKKIEEWKLANSLWVTKQKRPDLFKQIQLSEKEMILLRQYEDQINEKINTNG